MVALKLEGLDMKIKVERKKKGKLKRLLVPNHRSGS
jgi:hypothetical protein